MDNSQQVVRGSSVDQQVSHPRRNSNYEHENSADHTRRSVDGSVTTFKISGAEFTIADATSLPRRWSWTARTTDHSSHQLAVYQQIPVTGGGTYIDRLLSPRPLPDEIYRDRPFYTEGVQSGDDCEQQGAMNMPSSSDCSSRTCHDVIQRYHDNIGRVDVLSLCSDNTEVTNEHSSTDDDDDDDHDASDDTESSSRVLQISRGSSDASHTLSQLLAAGNKPATGRELHDVASQTELDSSALYVQPQQPVSRTWQLRDAFDDHSTRWYAIRPNYQQSSYSLRQTVTSERQRMPSMHKQLVKTTQCMEDPCESSAHDSLTLASEQNYCGRHFTSQVNHSQLNVDKAKTSKITADDEFKLQSEFSGHDLITKKGPVKNDDWNTPIDMDMLLTTRNGCTWHVDFDRNTRIWKLLIDMEERKLERLMTKNEETLMRALYDDVDWFLL